MELQLNTHNTASAVTTDVAALAFLHYETAEPEISPSLSFISTPALEFAETPDTTVSQEFGAYSPALSLVHGEAGDSFGSDYPIFDVKSQRYPGALSAAGQQTCFPGTLSHAYDLATFPATDASTSLESAGDAVFIAPTDLELSPASKSLDYLCQNFTGPISKVSDVFTPPTRDPPSFSRSTSDSSVFAVPKLPRGRKRKTSVDETSSQASSRQSSPKRAVHDVEEEEKIKLRAKNTESAARSRLRKKMEMAQALQTIQDLELEVQHTKQDVDIAQHKIRELEKELEFMSSEIAKKDALLAAAKV